MIRLHNDDLGRALHPILYQRLYDFQVVHSPEFPPNVVVSTWLSQFYQDEDNIHILVELNDDYEITAHCMIVVLQAFNEYKVVSCYQIQSANKTKTFLDECVEYIDKLRDKVDATCSVFTTVKGAKAYESKYGYKTARTVMIKYNESYIN